MVLAKDRGEHELGDRDLQAAATPVRKGAGASTIESAAGRVTRRPGPRIHQALCAVKASGAAHLNLDGTVIPTDRVAAKGPHGADLWSSGKYQHHGGTIQALSYPDGFPGRVSWVRPGREHDTTCAKAVADLLPALAFYEAAYGMPTLTDLGSLPLSTAIRPAHKKPEGGELTES